MVLQRRTEPTFQQLREAVMTGELGGLTLGVVTMPYHRPQRYYDQAGWRGTWGADGGGVLMNQGIHLADLLLWFMGDVAEVTAGAATLARAIEVEDCVAAMLRFTSGALGSLVATTAAEPGFPHRVEIYGDRGGVQRQVTSPYRPERGTGDPLRTLPSAAHRVPVPPPASGHG